MGIRMCDNTSVGVVLRNPAGAYALLTRALPPVGIAPAAGHVDEHGTALDAAVAELREELGVRARPHQLQPTAVAALRLDNTCRRPGGSHHCWWVYTAEFDVTLHPDARETRGAAWYTPAELADLAARTRRWQAGAITDTAWTARPGLEPVWCDLLTRLKHLT